VKTINTEEAAKILGIKERCVRIKASIGEIPAAKIGRKWLFIEEDLQNYIRSLYANQASAKQVPVKEKNKWHLSNVGIRTGRTSITEESDFDRVCVLAKKGELNSYTTN
jgi:excisionase family DNA binding protein